MRFREGNCASLIRGCRDHNTFVRTDTEYLLVKDQNQLALDRILMKLRLY